MAMGCEWSLLVHQPLEDLLPVWVLPCCRWPRRKSHPMTTSLLRPDSHLRHILRVPGMPVFRIYYAASCQA